jgi:hypothetical protein
LVVCVTFLSCERVSTGWLPGHTDEATP